MCSLKSIPPAETVPPDTVVAVTVVAVTVVPAVIAVEVVISLPAVTEPETVIFPLTFKSQFETVDEALIVVLPVVLILAAPETSMSTSPEGF